MKGAEKPETRDQITLNGGPPQTYLYTDTYIYIYIFIYLFGDMRKLMFWRVTNLACTGEGCTRGGVPEKDSPHTAKAPLYVFPSRSWCTGGVPG